jgi:NAD(P)H-flavin reductase
MAHDVVHLGSPVGTDLLLDARSDRPLLMVAGGTGLAPLKALIHELSITGQGRPTTLILGARTQRDLYDLPTLERFAETHRWLRLVPVVSEDPWYTGSKGTVIDAIERAGYLNGHEVYVCGGPSMVNAVTTWLDAYGVPSGQVRVERYGASPKSRSDHLQAIPDEARIR